MTEIRQGHQSCHFMLAVMYDKTLCHFVTNKSITMPELRMHQITISVLTQY